MIVDERRLAEIVKLQKLENADFLKELRHYFPNQKKFQGARILNICCGAVTEEPVLEKYFQPKKLVSIDYSEQMQRYAEQTERKSFVNANLDDLAALFPADEKFDFILGRNVPLSPNGSGTVPRMQYCCDYLDPVCKEDRWYKIFSNLRNLSHENTIVFLTLLRGDEFIRSQILLERTGFAVTTPETNKTPPYYPVTKAHENKFFCRSDGIGVAHDTKDLYVVIGKTGKI